MALFADVLFEHATLEALAEESIFRKFHTGFPLFLDAQTLHAC